MGKKGEEKTTYDRQEELSNLLAKIEIKNKIVSGPAVFLSGDDSYTVLFSTSQKGAGWIEIEDGGETVKYGTMSREYTDNRHIHAIKIKSQLDGRPIVSVQDMCILRAVILPSKVLCIQSVFQFSRYSKSDDINILVATDIHGSLERMKKAVGDWTDKADLVIMPGDIADQGETRESEKTQLSVRLRCFQK